MISLLKMAIFHSKLLVYERVSRSQVAATVMRRHLQLLRPGLRSPFFWRLKDLGVGNPTEMVTTQTLFPGFILSNQPMTKGTCAAKIKTEHSVLESLKLIEIMLVIYLNYTIKITMSFKQVGPRIHQNMFLYGD